MFEFTGLATGIGSLPHKDPQKALDLIFKYTPQIPFWPQLPKRDIREGMIAQFSENIPCLKVARDGLFLFSRDKDKELEIFYERIIADDVDYFKISADFALGLHRFYRRLEGLGLKDQEFIKCQVTGPFTFAASIKDENGMALLHDPVFMQVVIKGLIMKACWQIKLLRKFAKKIIIFIDEPYLGCFGSAYTPINRNEVLKALRELSEGIKSKDVLVGIHCCGNTDWSLFTDVTAVDLISFDAFSFLDKFIIYADKLKEFITRSGIICWGIVPTQEFSGKETPQFLIRKLKTGIDTLLKKGLDGNLLLQNLFLSPACGLGTLEQGKSEQIFKLLADTALALPKNI
jgi:methionine synthase II (cobalamin-independent)